jgi:lysozyme family protein
MKENFDTALKALLKHEGGFVNHPADPGGMTNLGVTKAVWEEWLTHPVTEAEMRALTPEKVAPLYRRKYWDRVCGDELPTGVDLAVFDYAVNSGPGRAVKALQKVLGVAVDGALGPQTLAKAVAHDSSALVEAYNAERLAFLRALPTFETFGRGWSRRVAEVTTQANQMTA